MFHEPDDELVEHVDEHGEVLEVVTRRRMRSEVLRHRCTYVFLVRPRRASGAEQRLVVHQRASWKSIYPGHWDAAFGGVCGVGESWESSARRELAEESGVEAADLDDLGPLRYEADDGKIIGRAFVAVSDAQLTCPDGEVVATDEVALSDLDQWLDGRSVSLDTLHSALPLFRRWRPA